MYITEVFKGGILVAQPDFTVRKELKNAFIVGWNSEATVLFDRILGMPALGYDVKGFIRPLGVNGATHYKNVPVIGDLETLPNQIHTHNIHELLIILSPAEEQHVLRIIEICNRAGITYSIIQAYDSAYRNVTRNVIREVIENREIGPRRVVDFLGAVFFLLWFLPLFVIIGALIKLESAGPVFYTQVRCGKGGRHFSVFKFRSMVQDAEKQSGPVWARKRDPRITRIGQFMRRTRIDELPQLINILKGDMSFIGPRPERPFFVEQFKKQIPFYINRMKIKPGATGLAQVNVGYDETLDDVRQKVAYDCEYIEHASSLMLNVKILVKTILVVILAEGQ